MKFWTTIIMISLLFGLPSLHAQSCLSVNASMTKVYCTDDFTRISEYLTGRENTRGACILRTDDCSRAGMYVILQLNRPLRNLGDNATLKLGYVLSNSAVTHYKEFAIPRNKARYRWIYVGITGQDWEGCDMRLVAWSVSLEGSQSTIRKASYLWEIGS